MSLNTAPLGLLITEQGRMRTQLKTVTLNHMKYKPVGSNAPPLIQKWEGIPNCITEDDNDDEAADSNASVMPTPMAPLLPRVS